MTEHTTSRSTDQGPRAGRPSRRRRRATGRWAAALLVGCAVSVAASGCGEDEPDDVASTSVEPTVITVTELIDRQGTSREGENVLVDAVLFDDGSGLRMCEALAESYPPQCAGRSLTVRNPGFVDVEMDTAQGIRWTDGSVWLLGWIEDGEFVVS